MLIQRVYDMKITHVFLQAFSDLARRRPLVKLAQHRLPMRADLFNFVARQLQTRRRQSVCVDAGAGVRSGRFAAARTALGCAEQHAAPGHSPYVRLSPWNKVRDGIRDIYQDLARYATFDGSCCSTTTRC